MNKVIQFTCYWRDKLQQATAAVRIPQDPTIGSFFFTMMPLTSPFPQRQSNAPFPEEGREKKGEKAILSPLFHQAFWRDLIIFSLSNLFPNPRHTKRGNCPSLGLPIGHTLHVLPSCSLNWRISHKRFSVCTSFLSCFYCRFWYCSWNDVPVGSVKRIWFVNALGKVIHRFMCVDFWICVNKQTFRLYAAASYFHKREEIGADST